MENYFNLISFVVGIVSIILAIVSLLMARNSKNESQRLNAETHYLLSQIKEISNKTHDLVRGERGENSKHSREISSRVIDDLLENAESNIKSKTTKRN